MPSITIQLSKNTPEKKKELIQKLTKAASEVTSIPESSFFVFIDEYELDSIGVGGQTIKEKIVSKPQ